MPDRREQIQRALDQLVDRRRAFDFQNIAFHVLKVRHPSLVLSEWNHDGGEDAFMLPPRGGEDDVSLACSLTAELSKVLADCRRIRERGVHPRKLLFATARAVERTTVDKWKEAVQHQCGVDLEVISRNGLVAELERPENEWICRDYLHLDIPVAQEFRSVLATAREHARREVVSWRETHGVELSHMLDLRLRPARPSDETPRGFASAEDEGERVLTVGKLAEQLTAGRQLVLQAPGGAGKTTALIQIADQLLRADSTRVPVCLSLAEWSTLQGDITVYLADALGLGSAGLSLLDENGALVLLLNGWNEVGTTVLPWAHRGVQRMLRGLPNACVVLTTREQDEPTPLTRPERLIIEPLTDTERRQAIAQAGVVNPSQIAERFEREGALDALTRLPLFLRVAISVLESVAELPRNAYGLLLAFVDYTERGEHRVALISACGGWHRDYLEDIASRMTDAGAVSWRTTEIVRQIGETSKRLQDNGLIGLVPDAFAILRALSSFHLLVSDGGQAGTVRFAHPLFQTWFSADWLAHNALAEDVDVVGMHGSSHAERSVREQDVLLVRANRVEWQESIELLVERLSTTIDEPSRSSFLRRVLLAVWEVDLLFCSSLLSHFPESIARAVRVEVASHLRTLYSGERAEDRAYAVVGMIATRSDEFADAIWTELDQWNRRSNRELLDSVQELSLRSLGEGWWSRLEEWSEDRRADFLHEMVLRINPEDLPDLVDLVRRDRRSRATHVAVVEALDWIGETALALELLADDASVWREPSGRQLLARLSPDVLKPIAETIIGEIDSTEDELVRVDLLRALKRAGVVSASTFLEALKGALDRSVAQELSGKKATRLLREIGEEDRAWAGQWVLDRAANGDEIDTDWYAFVEAAPPDRLVAQLDALVSNRAEQKVLPATRSLFWSYGRVQNREVVAALARAWLSLLRQIAPDGEYRRNRRTPAEELLAELEHALREQAYPDRAEALLACCDEPRNELELHEICRLLGPGGALDDSVTSELPAKLRERLRTSLLDWTSRLEAAGKLTRATRAELAGVLGGIADDHDIDILRSWIDEDLGEWERLRAQRGQGAATVYTNWYAGALARIGTETAARSLVELLDNPFYLRDASVSLVHMVVGAPKWHARVNVRRGRSRTQDDADRYPGGDVYQARGPALPHERERIGLAIAAAIELHLQDYTSTHRPYPYELGDAVAALARIGSDTSLPLIFRTGHIKHSEWGVLSALESIAALGTVLPAQETESFVETFLAALADPLRMSSHDPWPERLRCFGLLLMSDEPERGIERVRRALPEAGRSHRRRDLVELLGECEHPAAERLLVELFRSERSDLARQEEILRALARHAGSATASALEERLDALVAGTEVQEQSWWKRYDILRAIAEIAQRNSQLQTAILRRAEVATSGTARGVFLQLLRLLGGEDAALAACQLLVDPPPSELPHAVTELLETAITRREIIGRTGTYRLKPQPANALRRRLFELMMEEPGRRRSARSALLLIEHRRAMLGRPPSEPRHPAGVQPSDWRDRFRGLTGRPWVLGLAEWTGDAGR